VNTRDDQLDDELKAVLANVEVPAPDQGAKRRAMALARAEFEAQPREQAEPNQKISKGFSGWWRLIVGNQPDNGRSLMSFNRKLIYSGITTAAVAAVAVGISLQDSAIRSFPVPSLKEEVATAERERDLSDEFRPGRVTADLQGRSDAAEPALAAGIVAEEQTASDHYAAAPAEASRESRAFARMAAPTAAPAVPQSAIAKTKGERTSLIHDQDTAATPYYRDVGRDSFEEFDQNRVQLVAEAPVSTFSVDVDTASYSFVRRMLNSGVLPQPDAVRAEEMINYFDYDYPLPQSKKQPFRASVAVSDSPWAEGRKLLHIGIKGYDIAPADKPRSNLVFLLDVSGSMNSPDKLPLVIQSMELLLTTLRPDDTVAIAVYAGAAGTVLEPTPVKEKQKILGALRRLSAGGSTAGAQGIRLAYELAETQFDENAVNRVILATDGDFNVGITSQRELQGFIERKREEGIFLSVLGFGQGNYQDALMQTLAQNGNGVAAYIDTLSEAQKVLVDEATSTLFPIAKDVKLQLEFNPTAVSEYRLIGYETRHLNREDFNNDAVDAGDIGAGHTVTAIYEFTPAGSGAGQIEDLRYAPKAQTLASKDGEYAYLKLRYKLPDEDVSQLITQPVTHDHDIDAAGEALADEAGFATAVAGFAQLLKGGKYTGDYSYDDVIELAQQTKGDDTFGYRTEFIQLVRKAKSAAVMQAR
jgi:Ca-activated chloride channel family protein